MIPIEQPGVSKIAQSIVLQLPADAEDADPTKTIKGHIKLTRDFFLDSPEYVLEFSEGQMRMAYRTLYGLVRAAWKAKTGKFPPNRQTVEYPPDIQGVLVDGLTGATPLTANELKGCLEEALLTTRGLYPAQEP
jgi:hypothetical protein